MQASDGFEDFVPAGLASLGVEADEQELAIMRAAHNVYWPAISALLSLDLGAVPLERDEDLSRAPADR
jgi:hypothetical protein